ncbi:MAG: ATP-binding protein [bacterium]
MEQTVTPFEKSRTAGQLHALPGRQQLPGMVITTTGAILSCNAAALRRCGHAGEPVAGRQCSDVMGCAHPSSNGCVLTKVLRTRKRESGVFLRGTKRFEEVADPLFDANGELSAIMISFALRPQLDGLDLTKLHRLEATAQAASGIVHDLNNIFTRICGGLSLLKFKAEEDPAGLSNDPLLSDIQTAGEQGAALASHLVGFCRGETPGKSTVMISDSIQKAMAFSLLGSHSVKPEVLIQDSIWPIEANQEQMRQLISNLLINALHAVKSTGGAIRVAAENVTEQDSLAAGLAAARHVRITVKDEGVGILPEHLDHLFEPFFTTKKDGTGLGLALAALIVKDHGGRIEVDSELGRGTTFIVHLRASECR